jgi:hypothetical protein
MLLALGMLVLNMLLLACVLVVNRRMDSTSTSVSENGDAKKKELWFLCAYVKLYVKTRSKVL